MQTGNFRPNGSAAASPLVSDEHRLLEREAAALQRRTQDVLNSPLLKHTACEALASLAQQVRECVRRLNAELPRTPGPVSGVASSNVDPGDDLALRIARLRQQMPPIHLLLDHLSGQLQLLEATTKQVVELDSIVCAILNQPRFSYSGICDLADQVINQVLRNESLSRLLPVPGLQTAELAQSQTEIKHAALYVKSLEAARQLIWTLRHEILREDSLQVVTAAALMQDCGLLVLAPQLRAVRSKSLDRARWLLDQHPVSGAALLAGISDAPVELAAAVATHHERLDGSGYPRRLYGDRQARFSRWLGAINRLGELSLDVASAEEGTVGLTARLGQAAQRLQDEAQAGQWDVDFTGLLLERLQPEIQVDLGSLATVAAPLPPLASEDGAANSWIESVPERPAARPFLIRSTASSRAREFDSLLPGLEATGTRDEPAAHTLQLHGEQLELSGTHSPQPAARSHRMATGKGVFERSPLPM